MYEMKDDYLVGIPEIDEEHARLFEIAENIYQLQQKEFVLDKYDYLREIVDELIEYTLTHLDHEEAYMESIQYKHTFMQKVQHDAFRLQIEDFHFEIEDDSSDEKITELLELVTNWFINHILENDKLIGQA